tara:strand:- start:649 stop:1851 length:1203 start_codon:yes stop_codon:yes gene_type:complete
MISKLKLLTLLLLICSIAPSKSEDKFEGLVASVDSEAITTYDLSQRIKLVLKSLKLDDNIKNRDSVRDRVLELLIIEKIKKIEASKAQVIANTQEVREFASIVYNFPLEDFEDFRLFLEEQGIDFEIVEEQLRNELLWKKLSQQLFSSKITINSVDIDAIINNYKNKVGKLEYDYSEINFINDKFNDWKSSKKKMNNVITLINDGTSFDLIAEKFSDTKKRAGWVLADSLDNITKETLNNMKIGEIKGDIKTNNGYKILKLNKKRKFGKQQIKLSFVKFSSVERNNIENVLKSDIDCNSSENISNNDSVKELNVKDVMAKDISAEYSKYLEETLINNFSEVFEIDGEYNLIFVCNKSDNVIPSISRENVERRAFSKKFNQLSNTFLSNIRKSTNIKFFNR